MPPSVVGSCLCIRRSSKLNCPASPSPLQPFPSPSPSPSLHARRGTTVQSIHVVVLDGLATVCCRACRGFPLATQQAPRHQHQQRPSGGMLSRPRRPLDRANSSAPSKTLGFTRLFPGAHTCYLRVLYPILPSTDFFSRKLGPLSFQRRLTR